jgi:RHS repeat-associated protein
VNPRLVIILSALLVLGMPTGIAFGACSADAGVERGLERDVAALSSTQHNAVVRCDFAHTGSVAPVRQYDPVTGRFAGEDPLDVASGYPADALGVSAYVYAVNGPLVYTDPSGGCPVCAVNPLTITLGVLVITAVTVAVDAAHESESEKVESCYDRLLAHTDASHEFCQSAVKNDWSEVRQESEWNTCVYDGMNCSVSGVGGAGGIGPYGFTGIREIGGGWCEVWYRGVKQTTVKCDELPARGKTEGPPMTPKRGQNERDDDDGWWG